MKSLYIAGKDLLITIRDWQGLLIFLAMPMILIAILGAAMGSNFDSTPKTSLFDVGFVNDDEAELSEVLKSILTGGELSQMMRVHPMTESYARKKILSGELQVALMVPSGFTEKIYLGEDTTLTVLKDSESVFRAMVVESVASSFVEGLTVGRVGVSLAASRAISQGIAPNFDPALLGAEIALSLREAGVKFEEQVTKPHRSLVTSFQYYAAAMAVMFMMSAGAVNLETITSEKRNLTWERLLSSPTTPLTLIGGKFVAGLLVNTSQFLILMLGTTYIYKVHWGNNMFAVLVAGMCYGVAISGLSLLIAASVKSQKASLGMWSIGVQVCAALGGSMIPVFIFPQILQNLARFSPNYWGIRMFLGLMSGDPLRFVNVMPLLLIGSVALVLGAGQILVQQRRA